MIAQTCLHCSGLNTARFRCAPSTQWFGWLGNEEWTDAPQKDDETSPVLLSSCWHMLGPIFVLWIEALVLSGFLFSDPDLFQKSRKATAERDSMALVRSPWFPFSTLHEQLLRFSVGHRSWPFKQSSDVVAFANSSWMSQLEGSAVSY